MKTLMKNLCQSSENTSALLMPLQRTHVLVAQAQAHPVVDQDVPHEPERPDEVLNELKCRPDLNELPHDLLRTHARMHGLPHTAAHRALHHPQLTDISHHLLGAGDPRLLLHLSLCLILRAGGTLHAAEAEKRRCAQTAQN